MRTFYHIDLSDRSIKKQALEGEDIVRAGRYLIAKTLVEQNVAKVDPLSKDNPLIFSAGPFAGSNFSNANRLSVGCKSPLTGGIKEANSGGTFAFALGQLELAGLTLYNCSDEWIIIRITKDGEISFDPAEEFMGMGNFDAAAKLHEKYGKKVSIGLCSQVGEYQGMLSGIAFSDVDLRPSRLSARGGVGAVMGNKKVKAIVVDLHKMPTFHERKKLMGAVREYNKMLQAEPAIDNFAKTGTAMMSDVINQLGGIQCVISAVARQPTPAKKPSNSVVITCVNRTSNAVVKLHTPVCLAALFNAAMSMQTKTAMRWYHLLSTKPLVYWAPIAALKIPMTLQN